MTHKPSQDHQDNIKLQIFDLSSNYPKRSYNNLQQRLSSDPEQTQYKLESQGSKLRMSHQLLFKKLMANKQDNIRDQQQHLESPSSVNPDLYLTTTEEESGLNSSSLSIRESFIDDSESFRLCESSDDENNQNDDDFSQKQSDQSEQQKDNNDECTQSVWFIPFSKSQEQIKQEKQREEELLKLYTPLNQCQVLPWMTQQIKAIQDPVIRFHQQIRSFYLYIKPSRKETEIRMKILNHIKEVITCLFPQAQVHPFGSFATKLYLPDGDIDIVVLIDAQTSDRATTKQFYKAIYKEFKLNHRSTYSDIEYISTAKTPLVKMYHKQTGFSIDISLNQCSGLEQIYNIQKMKKMYPQFKYLIFVLKLMLKIRNLCETYSGGIGSFLLVCMLYHFLRDFHHRTTAAQAKHYGLGDYILSFFSFYFMNVDFWRQTINVKSGLTTDRNRKPNSISMISPLDDHVDIGKKAWRMSEVLAMFKNRCQVIKEKSFDEGESILKELINPAMKEFEYFELKEKFKPQQSQEPQQQQPQEQQQQMQINTDEVWKNNNGFFRNKTYSHRRYYKVSRDTYKTCRKDSKSREDEDGNSASSFSY